MKQALKKIITTPVDWVLYGVLNEQQRGKLTSALSGQQKDLIKRLIHGKNQKKREQLKQIKYHLYNLGFTHRAVRELERFYEREKDPAMKRLAAWELALWHANAYTVEGAKTALSYLQAAKKDERDETKKRRMAIVEAECLDLIGGNEEARTGIRRHMNEQEHPDLYLAAANLEDSFEARLPWLNKALNMQGRAPVQLQLNQTSSPGYADLCTSKRAQRVKTGPKVSVILPAFKAEEGLSIALDSLLDQTWQNVELLVVDDCSPDGTAEVIQQYAGKDERVRFLQTPENSGPYVARNIALQAATGEFVTVNDADDWAHAEKIETQVTHLIANPDVIANTSQLARMTENELKFYRRGTPGRYIFANMSSILFRREPVLQSLGSWDSVRFAADGEFKRRLLHVFGKEKFVDLETGPLSLPRQALQSLTSSSAFGYNGFFMGVRKEYVESFSLHHAQATSLTYDFPMEERPYPVPEPMKPQREEKRDGKRLFDVVIATDFRQQNALVFREVMKQKNAGKRIGFVQLNEYKLHGPQEIDGVMRDLIDGEQIQLLVYGETIEADQLIVFGAHLLSDWQTYVPQVNAKERYILIEKAPKETDNLQKQKEHLVRYFGDDGIWLVKQASLRQLFLQYHGTEAPVQLEEDAWETVIHGK